MADKSRADELECYDCTDWGDNGHAQRTISEDGECTDAEEAKRIIHELEERIGVLESIVRAPGTAAYWRRKCGEVESSKQEAQRAQRQQAFIIETADETIRNLNNSVRRLRSERDKALRDSEEWQLSAEMACQCPPDGCDCCGCQYAAQLHALKETDK
jgi:hypothetical protein